MVYVWKEAPESGKKEERRRREEEGENELSCRLLMFARDAVSFLVAREASGENRVANEANERRREDENGSRVSLLLLVLCVCVRSLSLGERDRRRSDASRQAGAADRAPGSRK